MTAAEWGAGPLAPGPSPLGGRGVFAIREIAAGERLERACTNEVGRTDRARIDGVAGVGDYYFQHPAWDGMGLLVFGLLAMCNHADPPNAELRFVEVPGIGWVAELWSIGAIGLGDEVTIRYRCELWFEPRAVARASAARADSP